MGNLNASQSRSNLDFYWGPDQQSRLIALAAAGHSGAEIAAQFGTSRDTVLGRAWRTGVKLNGKRGRRSTRPTHPQAQTPRVHVQGRRRGERGPDKPFSQKLEAAALHLAGFKQSDVARLLGHTQDSVSRWSRDGKIRPAALILAGRAKAACAA